MDVSRNSLTGVARVHSHLPECLQAIVGEGLGELEHVAHAGEFMRAAEAASEDPECVAFVGPLLSWQVAETAELLNQAGIPQLAIGATYSALTRDEPGAYDGMPASLCPTGERTLFRLVPRDTAIARAVVARWPRARLVSDGGDYGRQIASQLRMVGLEEDPAAELTIYAGLAEGAPPLQGEVLAFEGAAEPGFHATFALPQLDHMDYRSQAREAAALLRDAGRTRAEVLADLRASGRFDGFGDTTERRVGLWNAALQPIGTLEDPGG